VHGTQVTPRRDKRAINLVYVRVVSMLSNGKYHRHHAHITYGIRSPPGSGMGLKMMPPSMSMARTGDWGSG
jgi:hypothetical protein